MGKKSSSESAYILVVGLLIIWFIYLTFAFMVIGSGDDFSITEREDMMDSLCFTCSPVVFIATLIILVVLFRNGPKHPYKSSRDFEYDSYVFSGPAQTDQEDDMLSRLIEEARKPGAGKTKRINKFSGKVTINTPQGTKTIIVNDKDEFLSKMEEHGMLQTTYPAPYIMPFCPYCGKKVTIVDGKKAYCGSCKKYVQ